MRQRLSEPHPNLIPARADLDLDGRIRLFVAQAEAVHATVRRIDRYRDLPGAVIDYLRLHNLPPRLAMARDPLLAQADWQSTMLEIHHGPAVDQDLVGLTTAYAGIAETGTLMLLSAPETPTTLAFLPETSLVALSAERIVRAYEDAFALLRAERARCRARSTSSPGRRARATSSRPCSWARTDRAGLCVLLVDEPPDGGETAP